MTIGYQLSLQHLLLVLLLSHHQVSLVAHPCCVLSVACSIDQSSVSYCAAYTTYTTAKLILKQTAMVLTLSVPVPIIVVAAVVR
jgi:hypothetical protein